MKHNLFFQAFILLSLLLTACGGNDHFGHLKNKLLAIKHQEQQQKNSDPLVELKMPPIFEYSSSNANNALKVNSGNPLENFPITSIQFIGTLKQNNRLFAYVMLPNNMVYTVKIGDILGEERGKISNITENRLEITKNNIESGKQKQETIILKLKE